MGGAVLTRRTANATLEALKDIAGWDDEVTRQVSINGADPVLPTRFLVGETVAGIHAACGAAAADLWALKTGHRQQVTVDVDAAAATIQSFMYLRVPGDVPERPPMISGFYRTKDERWFFVHTGFPHLREGVIRLLGCEDSAESAAAAVLQHDALELEDAFAVDGLCGATVRSADEWAAHPQGKALAGLPLVDIIKIGDSPPEPLPNGDRPLSGVRSLDLTRVLAGPTCSRTLAEHGADVLRVGAEHLPSVPMFAIDTGHGKRATFLDLRRDDATDRLWDLIGQTDVFSQSYRLGALAGRGFTPETVAERRPGIVYVFMNCYGAVGPWAGRRGWEQLAQTATGLSHEEGDLVLPEVTGPTAQALTQYGRAARTEPGVPRLLPGAITDYMTGYLMAFGAMVALARRAREGGSYLVRASLTRSGMYLEGLGRADPEEAASRPRVLPVDRLAELSTESDTAFGRIQHLAPVVKLSETPARWEREAVPLGTHQPEWLDRPR
jgi:crotonobetainyl-CoA:carnitine CoA-transferase CaiB-like acyl-CoA transferase